MVAELVGGVVEGVVAGTVVVTGTVLVAGAVLGAYGHLGSSVEPAWPASDLATEAANLGFFYAIAIALIGIPLVFPDGRLPSPRFRIVVAFVVVDLVGWTIGLQSLSRAYVVSTYLMLGIQVAYANLAGLHLQPRRLLATWDRGHLVRFSGTEPLVRVMVEARDAAQAKACAQRIADTLKA